MSQPTLNLLHEKFEMKDEEIRDDNSEDGKPLTVGQFTPRIILQIANLAFCWFCCVFVFYGLNLNSVYLEYWNKYINFIVSFIFHQGLDTSTVFSSENWKCPGLASPTIFP